jgi:AraC-like DNA-binding protein
MNVVDEKRNTAAAEAGAAAHVSESAAAPMPPRGRPESDDPIYVYVHPHLGSTFITGADVSNALVCRHDVVIILGLDEQARFEVTVEGVVHTSNAVAFRPSTPHAVFSLGRPQVKLVVPFIHPRFNAVRTALQEDHTPLARPAFDHLNERFREASQGRLTAHQAAELMDAVIDVVTVASPPRKPLDPRIRHALRRLASDIDYPFHLLVDELQLSASRLSHLFTEQLGLSMRGCQAWARMAFAWELVVWRRELSFTDIAHMMKFSDSSHLSRAFKGAYGMSPSGFRNESLLRVIGQPVQYPAPAETGTIKPR